MELHHNVQEDLSYGHRPVLLEECLDALCIRPDGVYVDGTLGRAGHSLEIARRLTTGRLIGIDRDETAITAAKERLRDYLDHVTLVHSNFDRIGEILEELNISGVDGMLFDLGVSSPQLDDAQRGFSYMHDAPLDMRMDRTAALDARQVVNQWPYEELRRILYDFGEERYAPAIAKGICRARETAPIETTLQLVDVIKSAMPPGAAGEAAPRQAELSGHPHRRQRRAGRPASHAERRVRAPERGRTAGGDLLPLAGGSHHQENHAGAGHRLYLSSQLPRVRMREEAENEIDLPQAHCTGRSGADGKSPCPQRQAARGGEAVTVTVIARESYKRKEVFP